MIKASLATVVLVTQSALGLDGPYGRLPDATGVVRCESCGVRVPSIDAAVRCLGISPRDEAREDAARALRFAKWSCHPEIITALSDALSHDPDWCVREESAESLTRLGSRDPEAHYALARAAVSDPRLCVRIKARRGLASLSRRCDGDCPLCDRRLMPGPPVVIAPSRGLIPSIDIAVPGVRFHLGPRRLRVMIGRPVPIGPPIVVDPSPDMTPAEPDLRPAPPSDDVPPPRPEPSPFGAPRVDPPSMPEPIPSYPAPDRPSRRSSSKPVSPTPERPSAPSPKPVTPDADLPPLVGPSGTQGH